MSQANTATLLPTLMEQKLSQIGKRQLVIAVLRAITVGISVFIIAMLIAMFIDWQFTLFSTKIRLALTVSAVLVSVCSTLIAGVPPLLAALKRVRAASSADAEIPQLEERWQTVVTMVESVRRPTSPAAIAMLQQVTSEAVAIGRLVQPQRVADQTSLKTAIKSLSVCAIAFLGFLLIDWPQTSVLLRRFLAPMANISATSLRSVSDDITVARGEFVDLVTETSGLQRAFATLSIVRPEAQPFLIEVAADSKQTNRFAHRIQADESFQYQMRAGDGQTTWHKVNVVDYPAFAEVKITVISPTYLNRPNVEKTVFPARLKVPQGSMLMLQMLPKAPLQKLELVIAADSESKDRSTEATVHQLMPDADGWYRFQTQLVENVSLTPQLWNSHGLTNEDRTVCRIQVIADNAPVARVLNSTDEMSVANDDVVDIKFEAHDDHGIAKAELVIYDESSKEEGKPAEILKVLPIELGDQENEKHVVATTQLDLKKLDLKPGAQISYSIRVTDNRAASQEVSKTPEKAHDTAKSKQEMASAREANDSQKAGEGQKTKSDSSSPKNDVAKSGSAHESDSPDAMNASKEAGGEQADKATDDQQNVASTDPQSDSESAKETNRSKSSKPSKASSTASTTSESSSDSLVVEQDSANSPKSREGANKKSSSKSAKTTSTSEAQANSEQEQSDSGEMAEEQSESGDATEQKPGQSATSREQSKDKSSSKRPKNGLTTKPQRNDETPETDSDNSEQDGTESADQSEQKPGKSATSREQSNDKPSSKRPKNDLTTKPQPSDEPSEAGSDDSEQGGTESADQSEQKSGKSPTSREKMKNKPAKDAATDEGNANDESATSDSMEATENQPKDDVEQKPRKSSDSAKRKNKQQSSTESKAAADSPESESMDESTESDAESTDKKSSKTSADSKSSKPSDPTPKEGTSKDQPEADASNQTNSNKADDEGSADMPPVKEGSKSPSTGDPTNSDEKNSKNAKQESAEQEPSTSQRNKPQGQQEPGDIDLAQPPEKIFAMNPQTSDGQDSETKRQRLKITARLSAIAESRQIRKSETGKIRDRVAEIDAMLAVAESGLTRVVNRDIPDDDRSAQFKLLDNQLGDVEGKISTLRKQTRDSEYEFMGLQMVDVGRTHISPARERVFTAIRETATSSDGNSRSALQQIVRARELLAALLIRFDKVNRDKKLAEDLDQGIKIYEVYVEKSQSLLREARQNQNPLERKMAVLEVGQDYLDRYAEVLAMRRDMLAEFGRILGDDPRLLARYLDLVKRRRTSLRNQLSELAKRQQEITTELGGWVVSDDNQRQDLWTVAVELRMQAATQLAKDAAELAERIEKQFPLVLEATQQTQARVIELGKQTAEISRAISLEAKRQIRQPNEVIDLRPKARQLVQRFVELDAMLEQLNFENSSLPDVTTYVTGRLLESRTVADQAGSWKQTAEFAHDHRFSKLMEVDQHRLTIATELLRMDMLGIETELSAQFQQLAEKSVPEEIANWIRELQQLMLEITFDQGGATFEMTVDQLPIAYKLAKETSDSFEKAEKLFDRIRVAVAAALDEIAPRNPTVADLEDPKLDEFLTQLEKEPNIEAQLGLGDRPRNIRVLADTMQWQQSGGLFLNEAEEAARERMKQEMAQDDKTPKPDPKPEKPEEEISEKQREEREQAHEMELKLAKELAELKERADDPKTDPAEREQIQQMQQELQQKMADLAQLSNAGKLAMQLKEDLMRTIATIKEEAGDQPKESVDNKKMDQMMKDLNRIAEQVGNEPNSDNRWKMVTEYERKKQILKAIARGQHIPDEQWNKLLSSLDDGLWQIGGRTLPEEYRKAIEQYQEQIRRLTNDSNDKGR